MAEASPGYEVMLRDIGASHPSVIVIDAGLATSMKTKLFEERFPDRYFNLGIAEQNAVSVASGLARRGLIPLVHTFSNFIVRRAHDQVALSVAWPGCNVKFIAGSCGLFDGRNGPSHLAIDDLAAMMALPGVAVVEPGDQRQTRELLSWMLAHDGPVYFRLRRHGVPSDLLPELDSSIGTIMVQRHEQSPCTLVACGSMLEEAQLASQMLLDDGIPIDLIHVSILRPLDSEPIISSTTRTHLVVTLENHVACGALGDAVARVVGPMGVRHFRLSLPDEFLPAGDPPWQLAYCGLDAVSLVDQIKTLL